MARTAVLVLLALPLLGCPYEGPAPVAPASDKAIDPRLAGEWRCVGHGSSDVMLLTITSPRPALFEATAPDEPGEPPIRLHGASLAGKPLLNAEQQDRDGKKSWALVRYTLYHADLLEFQVAREEPFKGAPAGASLADLAARALDRGELFEGFCACVRADAAKR
jgi:hypothetical protein